MGKLTLRQWRRVRDITQMQMAEALGVSIGTYQAWERCPAKVKTGQLIRMAKLLDCDITDMKLLGDGEKVAFVDRETGE